VQGYIKRKLQCNCSSQLGVTHALLSIIQNIVNLSIRRRNSWRLFDRSSNRSSTW